MTYRLLHLADLHLDRTFAAMGCQPDVGRRRRLGLRDALRAAGDAALANGCDAITIGGDLYEHERAGLDTERFLVQTFAAWRPLRVFIAPGNHDALLPGSLYRRAEWTSNVHVFSEPTLQPVELDTGLTLWGLAHREPAWQGNPLDCERVAPPDMNLALFHGAEMGSRPDGKAVHGPFQVTDIAERGFAAALCGHYHRRRLDEAQGLLYPGSPEPLTFDERGTHGPVVVSIEGDGRVSFEALHLNRWTALDAAADLTGVGCTSDAMDAAAGAGTAAIEGLDPAYALLRLTCTGDVDSSLALDTSALSQALRERCGVAFAAVIDGTGTALDAAALAAERSARGAFLRAGEAALAQAGDEAEAAILSDALRYGLAALAGAEVGLR